MSKSVLVMDTPKNCLECIMLTETHDCIMQDKEANYNAYSYTKLQEGCPLREMPEKIGIALDELNSYTDGWNACIDAITGEKTMTEDLLIIKRGYIYEFTPKTDFGCKVFALAVSADRRGVDNIVSIVILSPNPGADSVQIVNNTFPENVLWCNCGKVTSTERERLTREVSKVSDKKMQKIDNMIAHALGINPLMMEAENKVYKELYTDLMERLIGERYGKTDTNED